MIQLIEYAAGDRQAWVRRLDSTVNGGRWLASLQTNGVTRRRHRRKTLTEAQRLCRGWCEGAKHGVVK